MGERWEIEMDDQQLFLRKLNRRTRFTQFLVWIALFFTAAGIAAGYKNWLRIHQKAKAGLVGIAEIREEIPRFAKKEQVLSIQTLVNEQLKNHTEHLEKSLKELRNIEQSTKHIAKTVYTQIEDITQKYPPSPINNQKSALMQDWSLSEVHFLLQTAIHVLNIRQDKQAAMAALKLADEFLLKKGSAKYFSLRQQISQDIALLSQYTLPEIAILSRKISGLQKRLEVLENNNGASKKEATTVILENEKQEKGSIQDRISDAFNGAITVRRFDQPLRAEMGEETKKSLYQLLTLKLEGLRIMLMQRQNSNYHSQIEDITLLFKKYYSESQFASFKKDLDFLNVVNLTPEIPDISESKKLFESFFLSESILPKKPARKKGE